MNRVTVISAQCSVALSTEAKAFARVRSGRGRGTILHLIFTKLLNGHRSDSIVASACHTVASLYHQLTSIQLGHGSGAGRPPLTTSLASPWWLCLSVVEPVRLDHSLALQTNRSPLSYVPFTAVQQALCVLADLHAHLLTRRFHSTARVDGITEETVSILVL